MKNNHQEVIRAYQEGKRIQFRAAHTGDAWSTFGPSDEPGFFNHFEYRVHPDDAEPKLGLFARLRNWWRGV